MKFFLGGIGAVMLLVSAAHAQTPNEARIRADVRCMALLGPASTQMINQPNRRVRAAASLMGQGAAYFLGRVEVSVPAEEIAGRMRQEMASLKPEDIRAESLRCRREVEAVKARMGVVASELTRAQPAA